MQEAALKKESLYHILDSGLLVFNEWYVDSVGIVQEAALKKES